MKVNFKNAVYLLDSSEGFRIKTGAMLKAILFDLDNTLVLFDENIFYRGFLQKGEKMFADIMPAEKFAERLMGATRSLIQNNGNMTNAEYFIEVFAEGYENQQYELWKRFVSFYETEYDKLHIDLSLPDHLHKTMETIASTGLKLVLASNPLFPLNVQMKRLAWAGLDHLAFTMVTHLENMSFCKPRIEYYLEICQKIDETPENCLMVGNDPIYDMIAANIGMKTFLTNDCKDCYKISDNKKRAMQRLQITEIPVPDFTGSLSEVPSAVQQLLAPA